MKSVAFVSATFALSMMMAPIMTEITANYRGSNCPQSFVETIDYFPEKAQIQVSDKFTVAYNKYYKVVDNIQSGEKLVLYQCGTKKPSGFETGYKFVQVPVNKIAVLDTTVITFFELLGLRNKIKYVPASYVTSPCIQKAVAANTIQTLGWNSTKNRMILNGDDEVDVVFNGFASTNEKYVAFPASMDPGTTDRAEWIKFASLFFNLEKDANSDFTDVLQKVSCLSENSEHQFAKGARKPVVAWLNYQAQFGSTPETWSFGNEVFKMNYVTDAGGIPYVPADKVTKFTSKSSFLEALNQAQIDIVIDQAWQWDTTIDYYQAFLKTYGLDTLSAEEQEKVTFLKNKQVYRIDGYQNKAGGDGWFESAIAMPEVVLYDFVSMISPELARNYKKRWLRNIAKNEPIQFATADQCVDEQYVFGSADSGDNSCTFQSSLKSPEKVLSSGEIAALAIFGAGALGFIVFQVTKSKRRNGRGVTTTKA